MTEHNEEVSPDKEIIETSQLSDADSTNNVPPQLEEERTNPAWRWYVVHVYSTFEEQARMALLERVKMMHVEEKFGKILIPKTSNTRVLKSGKKKIVQKTSFPGYILVQMEVDENTNHLVCNTPKITGFVGNSKKPRPVTDQEVLRLTSPEKVETQAEEESNDLSFDKGETIKVIDGAFTNFDGVVEYVHDDRKKLRILVSIFGRETPVELDYSQVQKTT